MQTKDGDIARSEEGDDAELDILREIEEVNGATRLVNCETWVFDCHHFRIWEPGLDFLGKVVNFLGK